MEHAGGWNAAAATDAVRKQLDADLELEVKPSERNRIRTLLQMNYDFKVEEFSPQLTPKGANALTQRCPVGTNQQ